MASRKSRRVTWNDGAPRGGWNLANHGAPHGTLASLNNAL